MHNVWPITAFKEVFLEMSLVKSIAVIKAESIYVEWGYGYGIPGHGEAYADCGQTLVRGCLNVDAHDQDLVDGTKAAGKVYVETYRRSCFRSECPVCYEKWAGKGAGKIDHRIEAGRGKGWGRPIHLVESPPEGDVRLLDYPALRKRAYEVAKMSGLKGGCCIFHPYRRKCFACGAIVKEGYESCFFCGNTAKIWVFSPHFHMIGYGWIRGTAKGYKEHGWVVKNVGVRKSVSATAFYQLSHAGVHQKFRTITWFGKMSYNNFKSPPMPKEEHRCPICEQKLRRLWYFGVHELPQEEGGYWLDPEGWRYKPSRFDGG